MARYYIGYGSDAEDPWDRSDPHPVITAVNDGNNFVVRGLPGTGWEDWANLVTEKMATNHETYAEWDTEERWNYLTHSGSVEPFVPKGSPTPDADLVKAVTDGWDKQRAAAVSPGDVGDTSTPGESDGTDNKDAAIA
jgi:hypothetical protein